jgi:preprotein translocase SecF subunit
VFDIIGKRNWFFLFSGLIVVPGFIFILLTPLTNGKEGLQFSVDYTGGTVWEIQFKDPNITTGQVRDFLVANGIPDAEVSEDTSNYFTIRTKLTDLFPAPTPIPFPSETPSAAASGSAGASESPTATPTATPTPSPSPSASASATPTPSPSPSPTPVLTGIGQNGQSCELQLPQEGKLADIAAAIQAAPPSGLGPIACTRRTTTVGPIISAELIQQAVLLILLGSVGILIWVSVRFWAVGGFKFGVTALAALVHDVIVVVGLFAIMGTFFGVQIDSLFVTAMLTVIGFSVHDTIVVYDRIRENKARHAGEPFDAIVNHSILQTFGRSINTSFTVVLTLSALLLFAGASIKYFVLALLIGIISGTYSSIFNASPLLVVWQLWEDRRRAERLALARGGRRGNA